MTQTPGAPEPSRYIIRSNDPAHLATVIDSVKHDPAMQLVDTIGPAGAAHTAVVAMNAQQASALKQQYGTTNHLEIEQDRPLSLFDAEGNSTA